MNSLQNSLGITIALLSLAMPALAQETSSTSKQAGSAEAASAAQVEKPDEEPGCFSHNVKAVTDRPTASSGAETTQCGVLEVLFGPERIWQGHGVHQDDIAPGVQFGLTPRLDLHYARTAFFQVGDNPGPLSAVGDTTVGARYRLSNQSKFVPGFGAFYNLKVPTASVSAGIGTGRYDHSLVLIAGKDFGKLHVDFNVAPSWIGRSGVAGYDKNELLVLFGYYPLGHHLTAGLGGVGFTRLNDAAPANASVSTLLNWQVVPRLILDAGFDEGVTSAAPRKRIVFGMTFAPANLYALVAGPREKTR